MKKIFKIMVASLLVFAGCKKAELDLYPYNQVETSQAFNTEADVTLAVNGMYNGIRTSGSYYQGTWNIIADVLSDNVVLHTAGRLSLKSFYQWQYTGESTYGLFASGYSIVRRSNAILENIDKLPDGPFKNNAKAEALGIRAMTYFDMSRVYSKTYLNASPTDSTVAYVTTTDPTIKPSKEPLKPFYDKVISDLVLAETLINSSNGVGRLSKAAIQGLLSRVYLYKGDYTNCIASATLALGAAPKLPDIATFPKIWKDATEDGVLFKIKNTSIDNSNTMGVNYYQTVAAGIKSEYVVDFTFMQLFDPTDVRTATYIQTSAYNGVLQNHIIKYAGRTGGVAGVVDAKVIRTAEVLLNRAEASFRLGTPADEASALTDLNLLKTNRYTGFVDMVLSGQALLDEILKERRLELAFEGDRFWDLKRLNLPVQRDALHGDKADGSGAVPSFPTLAVGDHKFLMPYPQAEINFNKNFTQNPGY
jgi:hypothetical protein